MDEDLEFSDEPKLIKNNLPTSLIPVSNGKTHITSLRDTPPFSYDNLTIFQNVIGHGTYGEVEKHQLENGEFVAIKRFYLNSDESGMIDYSIDDSALKEIHCLQLLRSSPFILELLGVDIDITGKILTSIMVKYYQSDLMKFLTRLSIDEKLKIFPLLVENTLQALYHMYICGIIHGDIKPQNILVDYNNEKFRCVIADFGLAQQLSCNINERVYNKLRYNVYSTSFRPPEILINKSYNEKADIWAMGITYITFLTNSYIINIPKKYADIKREFNHENALLLPTVFQNLSNPLEVTEENINLLETGDIHDHIDVSKILEDLSYDLDDKYFDLLSDMLQLNIKDRSSILDILKTRGQKINLPYRNIMPVRGSLLNGSTDKDEMIILYFEGINLMQDICETLYYSINIFIYAVDLFERYLHNYGITQNNLKLLCSISVSTISKMLNPNNNIFSIMYTANSRMKYLGFVKYINLLEFESMFVQRMNYLFMSCEVDNYLYQLNKIKNPYRFIKNIFSKFNIAKIYPGELSYDEIIKIVFPNLIHGTH